MTKSTRTTVMSCSVCSKQITKLDKRGTYRLVRGAKDIDGGLCAKCVQLRYVIRAVTFPLAGPDATDFADAKQAWAALREAIAEGWRQARTISNWYQDQLYALDVRRNGEDKMPGLPAHYLYTAARERFPGTPSALLVAIGNAIEGKWRRRRYQVLWTGESSQPSYRYPQPYIVASQNWRCEFDDGNRPHVICSINGQRFRLRLRGGAEFRRQLADFRRLTTGEAVPGELAIYRVRAKESDHRNGTTTNESGRPTWRIMIKLVGRFPRRVSAAKEQRFFKLRSDRDSFLYGVLEDREAPWILHADRMRDWVFQHRRFLNRAADDSKHERRKPRRQRLRALNEYDRRCKKQHDRLNSFVQETAAAVAGFAARNKVTRVVLDDSYTGYVVSFPWSALRDRLAIKLDELGIVFERVNASDEAIDEKPDAARSPSPIFQPEEV